MRNQQLPESDATILIIGGPIWKAAAIETNEKCWNATIKNH